MKPTTSVDVSLQVKVESCSDLSWLVSSLRKRGYVGHTLYDAKHRPVVVLFNRKSTLVRSMLKKTSSLTLRRSSSSPDRQPYGGQPKKREWASGGG